MFALIFCLLSFLLTEAQTALENDKIPDDLLITLKRKGGPSSAYQVITITATGNWSYKSYSEMPVQPSSEIISDENDGTKTRVTAEKLKFLISEFEKIQFFKFGKDFPREDEKILSVNHQQTEIISIRINGQTKEVSNYLGDSSKRTRLLRDLAEKVKGVAVWNLENSKIPEDLEIRYRITDADKIQRDFEIKSNGEVAESFYSSVPSEFEKGKFLPIFDKSKTVGKISRQQLIQLIDEFEKTGFSAFKYSPLTKYDGCSIEPLTPNGKRKHIFVQINHKEMYASLYGNCNANSETNASKFEYMTDVIERLLKSIGAMKIN